MHLSNCEHPQRVYNKYTREFMYVPCGKCPACRNAHANEWVARLRQESKCWKHTLFFTLTYAMDKRPHFVCFDNCIFVPDLKSINPELEPEVIDLRYEYEKNNSSQEWIERNDTWVRTVTSQSSIPHLSKYHCQLFIKRLRKNLKNLVIKTYGKNDISLQDYLVRYYLIGEYGSTAYAPHYHGLLWFNSDKEYSVIKEALYKSWTFGIVDSSLVRADASQYVASYLNCTNHLPQLLQSKQVRPFALCSKSTPIGTLSYQNEDFEELFNSAAYRFVQQDAVGKSYVSVPLWRCIKDRIFPRLPLFDTISHHDRVSLYSAVCRFEKYTGKEACLVSFLNYAKYCYSNNIINGFFSLSLRSYFDLLTKEYGYDAKAFDNSIIHLYYISNRIYFQSIVWNKSLSDYVCQIEKFYENVKREKLKDYFRFQQDYTLDYDSNSLVGLDSTFLYDLIDKRFEDISFEEQQILANYGIDLDKFFSEDLSVRYGYIDRLLPQSTKDFREFHLHQHNLFDKRVKNKKKNEYLENLSSPYADTIKALSSF